MQLQGHALFISQADPLKVQEAGIPLPVHSPTNRRYCCVLTVLSYAACNGKQRPVEAAAPTSGFVSCLSDFHERALVTLRPFAACHAPLVASLERSSLLFV